MIAKTQTEITIKMFAEKNGETCNFVRLHANENRTLTLTHVTEFKCHKWQYNYDYESALKHYYLILKSNYRKDKEIQI